MSKALAVLALAFTFHSFSVANASPHRPSPKCCTPDPSHPCQSDPSNPTPVCPAPSPSPVCDPSQPGTCPNPTPTVPVSEIRDSAREQAYRVAERIAHTYGRLENYKYNFTEGFWETIANYEATNPYNSGNPSYSQGEEQGAHVGKLDGDKAGENDASTIAESAAQPDAVARFRAILNKPGAQPDLHVVIPDPNYAGTPGADHPVDLRQTLIQLDSTLQQNLARLNFSSDGFYLEYGGVSEKLNLGTIYGWAGAGHYEFVQYWFQPDYGFQQWRQQGLGGGFSYRVWDKLNSEEQVEYQNYFYERFREVMDRDYESEKTRYDSSPREAAVSYANSLERTKVYQTGYDVGYRHAHLSASGSAFHSYFGSDYTHDFDATAQYYLNNAVLEFDGLELTGADAGGEFSAGSVLGAKFARVVNLGRQAASHLVPSLTGDSLTSIPYGSEFSVPMSTSLDGKVFFQKLAGLKADVETDVTQTAHFRMGDFTQDLQFTASWTDLILDFVHATDSDRTEYQQLVLKNLSTEWMRALNSGQNLYTSDANPKSKLAKLVEFFESANSQDRAVISTIYQQVNDISNTGGGIHPFVRGSYRKLSRELR